VEPGMLAVIVVVPADTAVAIPVELMVAMPETLEVQVTRLVTSLEEAGCWPWPMIPVAVNWAVCPAASDWLAGVIAMDPTSVLLQPVNGNAKAIKKMPRQERFNALLLMFEQCRLAC